MSELPSLNSLSLSRLYGIKDMVYTAQFANHYCILCIEAVNAGLDIDSITPTLTAFELHFAKLLTNIPNNIVYPLIYKKIMMLFIQVDM